MVRELFKSITAELRGRMFRSQIARSFLVMILMVLLIELVIFLVFFFRLDLPLDAFAAVRFVIADFWFWLVLAPAIYWVANRFPFTRVKYAILIHVPVGLVASMTVLAVSTYSQKMVNQTGIDFFPDILNRWNTDTKLTFVFYLLTVFAIAAAKYQTQLTEARVHEAELREREARLQSNLKQARLDTLNAQLQPHFLFNAMHTLSVLFERDKDHARTGLKRLSSLLRSALRDSARDNHTLRHELEWVEHFLAFERLRFDLAVDLEIDLEDRLLDVLVPNMMLQPLVENALKHANPPEEGLKLVVSGDWVGRSRARITISDNGMAPKGVSLSPGDGLRLVHERLSSAFSGAAKLTIARVAEGGVSASVEFPVETSSERDDGA